MILKTLTVLSLIENIDDPIVNIQLHGFSDASLRAYKCCDCLRIDKNNVIIRCNLTSAKSKVNPTKKQSISRLELVAANLLPSLFVCVYGNLEPAYNFEEIHCWVDSRFVVTWSNSVSNFMSNMFSLE